MEEIKNNLVLPAIAVRGIVPLPKSEFKLEVGRDLSVKALEESESMYNGNILLLIQKDSLSNDINPDSVESVGVIAKIILKLKLQNGNYRVKFKAVDRIKCLSFDQIDPYIVCAYEKLQSYESSSEEASVLFKKVATEIGNNINYCVESHLIEDCKRKLSQDLNFSDTCDIIAYYLKNSNTSKYRYLEELDVNKRATMILANIATECSYDEIERKINNDVKKSIDESQKEYYLRERMKAIQNELGDKARQEEEVETLRKKINEIGLPENMKTKALKELERYANTNNQMAESGIIKAYLDLIVALPWTNASKDCDSLVDVEKALDKNHYGLKKVKERIVEYLAVRMMTGKNPSTILCFAGPPGVGKTSLARSIAEALGRKFIKQSLGGVRDESEIRGHRRTYLGALPGRIINGMKDAGTINPVFLLDEIDKMTSDYRGDPAAAMLEVLDPEQNKFFSDNYLEEPYDLSQVMFITTANSLESIPAPLRDRMEIIQLSSYTEYEKYNIGFKHLLKREIEAHGLTEDNLEITEDAMYKIIEGYTRESGVRQLDRLIAKICRKTVKDILINKKEKTVITCENLKDYLGKELFFNNELREKKEVGIVTGLAYTDFGGDTLDIEVTTFKGKGGLLLTGKLGDVMKESAQAALSYVKAHKDELEITVDLDTTDIHIHVPEGAVPKDGPSAGVTLTTALTSALSNRPVSQSIGMTGEITLRGKVLPIGGLREKSIAAVRTGLTKIFIPKENERDLDEVPNEVKEKLEIVPVEYVTEILEQVF